MMAHFIYIGFFLNNDIYELFSSAYLSSENHPTPLPTRKPYIGLRYMKKTKAALVESKQGFLPKILFILILKSRGPWIISENL